MDQILDIPSEGNQRVEYAGFWIRLGAYLIDGVLLWIVNAVITFMVIGSVIATEPNFGLMGIQIIIGVLYFAFMESSEKQGTLGKMATGIKVGDRNGNRISFGNAVGRYFAKFLSAIILGIGFMMAGWDDRKQALHDKIADTFVFEKITKF
jgi:uncharacterized RDD family membrane protein YckC